MTFNLTFGPLSHTLISISVSSRIDPVKLKLLSLSVNGITKSIRENRRDPLKNDKVRAICKLRIIYGCRKSASDSQGLRKPNLRYKTDTERLVLSIATCFSILVTIGKIRAQYVSSAAAQKLKTCLRQLIRSLSGAVEAQFRL